MFREVCCERERGAELNEEKVRDGWVEAPLVVVYKEEGWADEVQRGVGWQWGTPKSFFDEDYLYAEGLPMAVMRLLTAFFKSFRMRDRTTDVEGCFSAQNKWDLSSYPRLICHNVMLLVGKRVPSVDDKLFDQRAFYPRFLLLLIDASKVPVS